MVELDQYYDDVSKSKADYTRHKKREENDRVYMFLAGVNRRLDEVKGRILGRRTLLHLEKYSLKFGKRKVGRK